MVYITVGATASEVTFEELKAVVTAYAERARKEQGCVGIGFNVIGLKVTVIEQWTDQGVYQWHENQPETRAYANKLRDLIVQPLEYHGHYETRMPLI